MEGDGSHAALVLFMRTVYVEVAHAGNGCGERLHVGAYDLIKQVLRVAVDVKRSFVGNIFDKHLGRTVGSSRTCVDEGNAVLLRPMEKIERVAVVVFRHVAAVGFHCVRASALMKDHFGNG